MLVLLIIYGYCPLPTVKSRSSESAADLPDDQEPLTISINSKGEIYTRTSSNLSKWFLNYYHPK